MKVRVVLPMYFGGIRKEVGEIVDLLPVDAMGAIHRGRAERVKDEPLPVSGPMTINPVAKPVEQPVETPPVETPVVVKKRKFAQKE